GAGLCSPTDLCRSSPNSLATRGRSVLDRVPDLRKYAPTSLTLVGLRRNWKREPQLLNCGPVNCPGYVKSLILLKPAQRLAGFAVEHAGRLLVQITSPEKGVL